MFHFVVLCFSAYKEYQVTRPISRGKDISTIEGMKESSEDETKEEKKKRKNRRRLGDLDTTSEEEEDEKSEDYNLDRFVFDSQPSYKRNFVDDSLRAP